MRTAFIVIFTVLCVSCLLPTFGQTSEIRVFKGIPYAQPPVDDLRWQPPRLAGGWDTSRKADQFGRTCMQNVGAGASQTVGEDCLYLNIWTGAKRTNEKRPVMVWIYGGGYNVGSGSQPEYDGEALAKKGVVIVTINYRLGAFGFFSHPELTKETGGRAAANFGLMDSIAALQWVRKNIGAFGGDSGRVTIFGESAGAGLIANLMVSPQAKGLFHRAIGESSSWNSVTIGRLAQLAEAELAGLKFTDAVGARSLLGLRAIPADQILKGGRGVGPVVDGWFIPDDPGVLFAKGKQNDVPLLVGSNRDESFGAPPATAAQFIEQSRRKYGDLAETFLALYPAGSDEQARDSAFAAERDEVAWVMRNWARMQAKTGKSKAYLYYFTQQPPAPSNTGGRFAPTGRGTATHTAEIPYVFQNLRATRPWTDRDREVADAMSSYWVNFAVTGDPNGKGLPDWPAYDESKSLAPMVIGEKFGPGTVPDAGKLKFFEAYASR